MKEYGRENVNFFEVVFQIKKNLGRLPFIGRLPNFNLSKLSIKTASNKKYCFLRLVGIVYLTLNQLLKRLRSSFKFEFI